MESALHLVHTTAAHLHTAKLCWGKSQHAWLWMAYMPLVLDFEPHSLRCTKITCIQAVAKSTTPNSYVPLVFFGGFHPLEWLKCVG